jgi:hypothetical protein
VRWVLLILSIGLASGAAAPAPSSDSLEDLLRRAGDYVAAYERDVPAIVADEDYTQRFIVEPDTEVRRLRSEILTIRDESQGWVGFRDVYEIDGRPVRDRTDRLARLFLEPNADPRSQAKRIADESARFNLAPQVQRTINTPLLALQFIRPQNQARCTFKDGGRKTNRGFEIRIADFQERAMPRIIRTADDAAARGRFWIDPASGRVTETELFVNTRWQGRVITALIHVTYAQQARLQIWVPISMEETYQGVGVITGQATYSNFRRFAVSTETVVKRP